MSDITNTVNILTKQLKDKYYTFHELYEHRFTLFKIIAHIYPMFSWKSLKHFDEANDPMFEDSFIAGILTPLGNSSYHFKLDRYKELTIRELDNAPKYDDYTLEEGITRIRSLTLLNGSFEGTKEDLLLDNNSKPLIIKEEESLKLLSIINDLNDQLTKIEQLNYSSISDGNHKIKQLYKEKRELLKVICHAYKDLAWKSRCYSDGTTLNETFLVGLTTPLGEAGYILNEERFDEFDVSYYNKAPLKKEEVYDDILTKLLSLEIREFRAK